MSDLTSTLRIHTSWGVIAISLAERKVTACDLPIVNVLKESKPLAFVKVDDCGVAPGDRAVAKAAARFVREAIVGRSAPLPPLKLPQGSPMQQSVWKCLIALSRGQVISYGELAKAAGRPRAARAAGQACGANPIPLFIPCHRVLAANGKIGGFSGGLAWKEWLLDREAMELSSWRKR